jgi:hypothetical protein
MSFSTLPVLMDANVHYAPVLENHTMCPISLNSRRSATLLNPAFKLTI